MITLCSQLYALSYHKYYRNVLKLFNLLTISSTLIFALFAAAPSAVPAY